MPYSDEYGPSIFGPMAMKHVSSGMKMAIETNDRIADAALRAAANKAKREEDQLHHMTREETAGAIEWQVKEGRHQATPSSA